jgi:hypothetical protein
MVRRKLIFTAIAASFCFGALMGRGATGRDAKTSGAMPMPNDRAADSYAIYSVLMPGPPFDSMNSLQSQKWAIADTTVNISDMNPAISPEGQLKAPNDHPNRFHEAVRDFEARKYDRIQLTQQFHLGTPYTLMDAGQMAELRRAKAAIDAGSDLQSKYAAYPGVTSFSEVYFSSNHHAALVYMNNWCANLCQQGQWVYLEKHGGSWVKRSGIFQKMS